MRGKKLCARGAGRLLAFALSVALAVEMPLTASAAPAKLQEGAETSAQGEMEAAVFQARDLLKEGFVMEGGVLTKYTGTAIDVKLPNTVTEIGPGAFQGNTRIRTVMCSDALKRIGNGAFEGCSSLMKFSLRKVNYIGEGAFIGTAFKEVVIPEGVQEIGELTFAECRSMMRVFVPATVKRIADDAFAGCGVSRFTLRGERGSAAEQYAKQKGMRFEPYSPSDFDLPSVTSVTVTPATVNKGGESVLGTTFQLRATVSPAGANDGVAWESDNEDVVTVDQDEGLVTIRGYGSATVSAIAADNGVTGTCQIKISKEAAPVKPAEPVEQPELGSISLGKSSLPYTGEQVRPTVTVLDKSGKRLALNVDYTLGYENNVDAGTAKAVVTGIGDCKGTKEATFTISPKSIANATISPIGDLPAGTNPVVTVMDGAKLLKVDVDYTVENTAGSPQGSYQTRKVSVKGKGNYTGASNANKVVTYRIIDPSADEKAKDIGGATVTLRGGSFTYSGAACKPGVTVRDGGKTVSPSQYKVVYSNNVNAGTGKIYVMGVTKNGKGYYGISKACEFTIQAKNFARVSAPKTLTISRAADQAGIQAAIEDALTVKDGKRVLSASEYSVNCSAIPAPGSIQAGKAYTVTLTAKTGGNYQGTKNVTVKFAQQNLANKEISADITDAAKKRLRVLCDGKELVQNKDFVVKGWKKGRDGSCTVTIEGTKNGDYKGRKTFNLYL